MNSLIYAKEYYETFGNFCALTDSILEKNNVKISKYDKITYKNILKHLELSK
jgi:hypothetical protein